jgi:hypothetical protein
MSFVKLPTVRQSPERNLNSPGLPVFQRFQHGPARDSNITGGVLPYCFIHEVEVVYRGETHSGEHVSIIDRPTFEAVQVKLAENARARRVCVESSPAILMGRIFDDRGNRMTPSHSSKDGVRYRYYVSHVLLQRRKKDAGHVTRVPAIQLEKLVVEAICATARPDTEPKGDLSDRAVIDLYVTRIIVCPDSIDIELREPTLAPASSLATDVSVTAAVAASSTSNAVISLPWSAAGFPSVKGVLHRPEAKLETRDPRHYCPRRSQAARLDRRSRIGPRSIVRRDRRARRQSGTAHSPSDATCVNPATYIGRDH